jgi:NADH-quinone oxidoreductase subunit N
MAAVNAGYTWLALVAVVFSSLSAYFYLRIVMNMYMKEPKVEVALSTSASTNIVLAVTVAAVLFIGVLPSGVIEMARAAVMSF